MYPCFACHLLMTVNTSMFTRTRARVCVCVQSDGVSLCRRKGYRLAIHYCFIAIVSKIVPSDYSSFIFDSYYKTRSTACF